MEALTEFINMCLDIEISNAKKELQKNTTERKAIQTKIHKLTELNIKLKHSTEQAKTSDSSNEESSSDSLKETPKKKYHPPHFSTCSSSTDSDPSSSDSFIRLPRGMKITLPPLPGTQAPLPDLDSGSDPEMPVPLIYPFP